MSRRVLITGAQGFLGRYLVAHVLDHHADVQVFGLGRSPRLPHVFTHSVRWADSTVPAPLPPALEASAKSARYHYVSVDLQHQAEIVHALRDLRPDTVFHLASALRDAPPAHLFRTNVEGTVYLLEAVREAGIGEPRMVFGSTGFLYGRVPAGDLPIDEDRPGAPIDAYGVSKLAAEQVARILTERYRIPAVWARIFNLVGPGQEERHVCGWVASQAAAIAAGARAPVIEIGPLETTRDFIDVRDAAAALDVLGRSGEPGHVYNVATGRESSVASVFHAILRRAGLVGRVAIEERPPRSADIPRYVAATRRLEGLGFRPVHALDESLADLLAYYAESVAPAAEGEPGGGATTLVPTSIRATAVAHARYQVTVEPGIMTSAPERLRAMFPGARMVLLTDRRVHRLHGAAFLERLRAAGHEVDAMVIPDGERSKSLYRLRQVIGGLRGLRFDRRALLLNFGGGLVTDLGGFAAAVYMRGVSYVNLPTTLLAQHDAAVGGKVAANMPWAKNFVGAFHHPRAVFCDPCLLATLSSRELSAGIAEALKVAIIASPQLFELIERDVGAIRDAREPNVLAALVSRAVRAKVDLLAPDPHEANLRRALNLGHTFGHALEVQTGYRTLLHGEAVAFGLAVATAVARRRGVCSDRVAERIYRALRAYALPPRVRRTDLEAAEARLDEIRLVRGRTLNFVLPLEVGAVDIVPELAGGEIRQALIDLARHPLIGSSVVDAGRPPARRRSARRAQGGAPGS